MVIRFTLQLEEQAAKFYRDAAASSQLAQAKEVFTKFAENSEKRKKELERTARESVDHSLLEPVSGLFEETYTMNTILLKGGSISDTIAVAKQLEERMQKFYVEAGEKINFISNVSRLYKRCAQDRTKALTALQDFA
jgi:rubrerythrin